MNIPSDKARKVINILHKMDEKLMAEHERLCDRMDEMALVIDAHFTEDNRAPTPREKELEAQNKVLWELVDSVEEVLDDAFLHIQPDYKSMRSEIKETLAAIQKAKEGVK
jgi:hypothetical protein